MREVSVLGLNNNFYGSYSSNQVFFSELMSAFRKLGAVVYTASSVDDAVSLLKNESIDFSIGFSKYKYFYDNKPLYDINKIVNYQWVSDNPLKMNTDIASEWIRYIFIDEEYPVMTDSQYKKTPLFLPLGFLNTNVKKRKYTKNAILFPCKIRNLNKLEETINDSKYSEYVKSFLEQYSDEKSFVLSIKDFFEKKEILDEEIQIEIFRLSNEYVRIRKRLYVIENMPDFEIYILSENYENKIKRKNVHFISPVNYEIVGDVINEYKYVINVDPNYNSCVHDRFIKVVSSGSLCLTNENTIINNKPYTYKFNDRSSFYDMIQKVETDHDEIYNLQLDFIQNFSWEKSAERIIENYTKGISINGYSVSNQI